ncbi:MAG TPA: VOC family protein [Actinophytocola sp.]|uniref:VOC family protein n=1 Tax=Actinophytocola sp. TaxID=1872138 RepID=UPI002DBAAB4C|nr:VOC family protein [Actinophytocola sp.]HEU5471948.1 VOC family protein [Actinophytocola sp.]
MSHVTANQPNGTPTWVDLGIPDLDRAMAFYGAVFGWTFAVGPPEAGHYTTCLLDGRRVAALMPNPDPGEAEFWWNVYLATDDCDRTVQRALDAGGSVISPAMDVMEQGRMAIVRDPAGGQFGLWQGRAHIGAEVVNEPGSLVRNDLVTPDPDRARTFYAAVFDFTLDRNEDLPEFDFTFLRRPDGHEVAGIFGNPDAKSTTWATTFEVADTDAAVAAATAAGGTAAEPSDMIYGRIATVTDPFGAEFSVITRPPA